ncbi:hypothetical protein BGZ57DRAFT_924437 [Hyaloscypha finlandica]|nr:hypothetical protein BGZ57DRAFT_924437 [Hyaloscypha finlandica]
MAPMGETRFYRRPREMSGESSFAVLATAGILAWGSDPWWLRKEMHGTGLCYGKMDLSANAYYYVEAVRVDLPAWEYLMPYENTPSTFQDVLIPAWGYRVEEMLWLKFLAQEREAR